MANILSLARDCKRYLEEENNLIAVYNIKRAWLYKVVPTENGNLINSTISELLTTKNIDPKAIVLHKNSMIGLKEVRVHQVADAIKTMYSSGNFVIDKYISNKNKNIIDIIESNSLVYDIPADGVREDIEIDLEHFHEKLQETLKIKKIKSGKYAVELGLTKLYFSNIRNGRSLPSFEVLFDIAKETGTSMQYLLGLTNTDVACETYELPEAIDIEYILKAAKLKKDDFFGYFPRSIAERMFYTHTSLPSIKNVVRLSLYTGLSIDYMFGMTKHRVFEKFRYLPGQFGWIKIKDYYNGGYLVNATKTHVILDTEERIQINDKRLKSADLRPQLLK